MSLAKMETQKRQNEVWARREPAKLKFPPCTVCGRQAIGTHYGAITCGACKVFFARVLGKNERYTCKKDGRCPVDGSHSGAHCKGCRLQKCIQAGMAKDKSTLGRYNHSKRTETILKAKGVLKDKGQHCSTQITLTNRTSVGINGQLGPTNVFVSKTNPHESEFDLPLDTELASVDVSPEALALYDTDLHLLDNILEPVPVVEDRTPPCSFDDELDLICTTLQTTLSMNETPLSYDDNVVKTLADRFKIFNQRSYGDGNIKDEDFLPLQQEAHAMRLRKFELFGEMKPIERDEFNEVYKKFGLEIDNRFKHWENIEKEFEVFANDLCQFTKEIPLFLRLSKRDQANVIKAGMNDIDPIVAFRGLNADLRVSVRNACIIHIDDMVDVWMSSACADASIDCFKKTQQISPSPIECALLAVMCIVSTGRCKLENPALVEKIQEMTAERLKVEVTKTHGSSSSRRFGKLLDLFIALRSCTDLYYDEYKAVCRDEIVAEKNKYALKSLPEDE